MAYKVMKKLACLFAFSLILPALIFSFAKAEDSISLGIYNKNDQSQTISTASKGDLLFIKAGYQNSSNKTLKMDIWVTVKGVTELKTNFVLKKTERLAAGSYSEVSFDWNTKDSNLGSHTIRAKIFDPETHAQIGVKNDICMELIDATHLATGVCSAVVEDKDTSDDAMLEDSDVSITEMESDQNGIQITYPDKFVQNEATAVQVKTTNPNIKFIRMFVSRTDRIDLSENWTKDDICPKIVASTSVKNCEICHPVKLTCANGTCGEAKFAVDQLGDHRLIAVGMTTETGCQSDNILGINNEPIIKVVKADTLLAEETVDNDAVEDIEITGGSESITNLPSALSWIINIFLYGVIGIWTFISFIIGGFMFLTAGGNEEQVKKAKTLLIYAGIGLVLGALSYAIIQIVIKILNNIF